MLYLPLFINNFINNMWKTYFLNSLIQLFLVEFCPLHMWKTLCKMNSQRTEKEIGQEQDMGDYPQFS